MSGNPDAPGSPARPDRAALARVAPFAVFMACIGLEEILRLPAVSAAWPLSERTLLSLYPLRPTAALILLLLFRKHYTELVWADLARAGQTLRSLALGLLVFALWVNLDWPFATLGEPPGFNPTIFPEGPWRWWAVGSRVFGAVAVVPVMEELFWRSFLLRWLTGRDFLRVPPGRFTPFAFLASCLLFGLEHHFFLAGIAAGAAYALLLRRTGSLAQCVLCHAVTNLALAGYVLVTAQWRFW